MARLELPAVRRGEEPYSLRLAWSLAAEAAFPQLGVEIVATEIDDVMLRRSAAGLYQRGSLHDLPRHLLDMAFRRSDDLYEFRACYRRDITFLQQDIRTEMPDGPFDLILCRNLVFTYFEAPMQPELLARMCERLQPGGAFVIGAHERLPADRHGLEAWDGPAEIYRFSPSS